MAATAVLAWLEPIALVIVLVGFVLVMIWLSVLVIRELLDSLPRRRR